MNDRVVWCIQISDFSQEMYNFKVLLFISISGSKWTMEFITEQPSLKKKKILDTPPVGGGGRISSCVTLLGGSDNAASCPCPANSCRHGGTNRPRMASRHSRRCSGPRRSTNSSAVSSRNRSTASECNPWTVPVTRPWSPAAFGPSLANHLWTDDGEENRS